MSSVWFTPVTHKHNPTKVLAKAEAKAAEQWMVERAAAFVNEAGAVGRSVSQLDAATVFLYEAGELTATLHVEHLSPPTVAGRGDNWIKRRETH